MTSKGGNLLVAAPERWDEACFSVPAIRALCASGLSVGILCRETQAAFWQTLGNLKVLGFPIGARAKAAAPTISDWEAAIIWEPGFAADVVKHAKLPRVVGPHQPLLKKILTHPLRATQDPLEHRVNYYLSAVEQLGIETTRPTFFAPADLAIKPQPDAILLCPDSDYGPNHEWPLNRWEELARHLNQHGQPLTVAGLEGGRSLGRSLADRLGESTGFLTISPLANSLPTLAAHPRVIAADSSLPHLAAHVGATCITLFGPNDPQWKRPLGRRHSFVRRHVECAPCLLSHCPLDGRCQLELETAAVLRFIADHPAWSIR